MNLTDFQKNIVTILPEIEFAMEEPMAKHTSFRIGGPVEVMAFPKNADELRRLLSYIKNKFDFSTVQEFTVEAGRADSITREKLEVLKEFGVTRISVNPQTMKEETLKIIGRRHTVEQVKEAFKLAKEVDFPNINMDLILGLPGETKEDVMHTMEEVKKLAPDSLTVHSLAIKRASKLNQWIEEHGIETLNNTEKTMEIASKAAKEMGMKPYYMMMTHIPTGIVVNMQDEKSQIQNRAAALRVLKSRLLALKKEEEAAKAADMRHSQVRSLDRSERIRTYNFPENRIVDHRTGYKAYDLDQVMEGHLQSVIDSGIRMDEEAEISGE